MSIESLKLDLSKSIYTVITGENGGGKSTLIEAIAFALLERRKGTSYRDYIKTGEEKATIKMTAIIENEILYFDIEINRNPRLTPVKKEIKYKGEVYNNSECSKLLKTLNVHYLQFITFFHQKDNSIMNLSPAEISNLLKEVFSIDYSSQVKTIEDSIEAISQELTVLENNLKANEQTLEILKESPLDGVNVEELTSFKIEMMEKETLFEKNKDVLKIPIEREKLVREIQNIENKITNILQKNESLSSEIHEYEEELKNIEVKILNISEELDRENSLKDVLVQKIYKIEENINESKESILDLEHSVKKLEEEYAAYIAGICPVCNHVFKDVEKNRIAVLEEDIHQKVDLKQSLEEQLDFLLKEFVTEKRDLENSRKRIEEIQDHKRKTENRPEILTHLISSNKRTIEDQLNNEVVLTKQLLDLKKNLGQMRNFTSNVDIAQLSNRISFLKNKILEIEKTLNVNEERSRRNVEIRNTREKLYVENKEYLKTIGQLTKELQEKKEASTILSNDFPNYVILHTTHVLEDYMNTVVKKIFPNLQVKLALNRSGLSFFYSPDGRDEWLTVKMASGAQSAVLMLAWRVALAEMYGIDTLILDEIDADANDKNSQIVYEFLGSLDNFDQIILVTHRKQSLKTIRSFNESVTNYWVEDGIFSEDHPELTL